MKINIDPKTRASAEAAVAELSAFLEVHDARDREIAAFPPMGERAKADLAELNRNYRVGDAEIPLKIAAINESLRLASTRSTNLQIQRGDSIPGAYDLALRSLSKISALLTTVRDAVITDVKEKLVPNFGKDEANRLSEHCTPVLVLNELIRCRFDDGSRQSDEIFLRLRRMKNFAEAVMAKDWDPYRWRKSAEVMTFLNTVNSRVERLERETMDLQEGFVSETLKRWDSKEGQYLTYLRREKEGQGLTAAGEAELKFWEAKREIVELRARAENDLLTEAQLKRLEELESESNELNTALSTSPSEDENSED
jgi:hypothetical protein